MARTRFGIRLITLNQKLKGKRVVTVADMIGEKFHGKEFFQRLKEIGWEKVLKMRTQLFVFQIQRDRIFIRDL